LSSVPGISRPWAEVIYGKAGGRLAYAQYLFEEGKREFQKYFQGKVEIKDKMIIDIGCGDGGKTCFYASAHPKVCIGLDIDPVRVSSARSFGISMGCKNLAFVLGSSEHLPFKSGSFDIGIMNDVAEHFGAPLESLKEANRISKESGLLLVTFTSYRSAGGAHVFERIHVPWVQFMFSDREIIQALQHIYKSNRFIGYQFPSLMKGSPKNLSDLADINKMTLNRFSRLAIDTGFSFKLLTFRPIIERKVSYLLLKLLPPIPAELVTRKVICILQKQDSSS
jgi:ubiquinone/menaquinone biosynthesis C-methylase UbiE